MALKNNNGIDKKSFLVYSVLPTLVIAFITIFLVFFYDKPSQLAITNAAPTNASVATDLQADPSVDYNSPVAAPSSPSAYDGIVGMAIGDYDGKTPEILNILEDMGGFKEDESVSAANTVYIIYDPRCPYCHALFEKLEKTDKKGKNITIKWLPTVALGASEDGVKRASFGLHAKSMEDFAKSLDADASIEHKVSDTDALRLEENIAFLFEASNQTFGEQHPKSVPAAFFLDKKTGEPQMMYGASSDDVFRVIFGD